MSAASDSTPDADRRHYSYAHYANPDVASGFDELRFGGPIGRFLLEQQQQLLRDALAPVAGRTVVDVGTGTGRAAFGLSSAGAAVIGLDYSGEMLRVARGRLGPAVQLARADAHALPIPSRSVDAAVCLRVLMHATDWRQALSELCRVARWRVVVDFPSASSVAALESAVRRWRAKRGGRVEAYRVLSERDVREAFAAQGWRVALVRRQFVLPIALHKTVNTLAVTVGVERVLAMAGLLRIAGSPITMVAER